MKWPSLPISWCYNPSDAPSSVRDESLVTGIVTRAMKQWEGVSAVKFQHLGVAVCEPTRENSEVVIYWVHAGDSYLAQAVPQWQSSGNMTISLGYTPILNGEIRLNADYWVFAGPKAAKLNAEDWLADLEGSIAHEVGHTLGLGHSDDPESIMYANPYMPWTSLGADDIRAVQALYGAPAAHPHFSAVRPLAVSAPPEKLTVRLIDGQQHAIANLTPGSDVSVYARFEYAALSVKSLGFMIIDAAGRSRLSRHFESPFETERCSAKKGCVCLLAIASADQLAGLGPGSSISYLVNSETVMSQALPMGNRTSLNSMPAVVFSALPERVAAGQPVLLTAQIEPDKEGDALTGEWHIPGYGQVGFDVPAAGGVFEESVVFEAPGTYELFLSLDDGTPRYGGAEGSAAGQGARLIKRQVVTVQ